MAPVDNILLDLEIYLERQVRRDTKMIWLIRVILELAVDHIHSKFSMYDLLLDWLNATSISWNG